MGEKRDNIVNIVKVFFRANIIFFYLNALSFWIIKMIEKNNVWVRLNTSPPPVGLGLKETFLDGD